MNFFVQNAKQNNIDCIALLRDSSMADSMQRSGRFDPSTFVESIYLDKHDFPSLIAYLKKQNVQVVLPGTEYCIRLSDKIGDSLKLKIANPMKTTHFRDDKANILQRLVAQDIAVPKMKIVDLDDADLNGQLLSIKDTFTFPIFVKPSSSGGSFGIKRCDNYNELENFIKSLKNKKYALATNNIKRAIVQEFIDAPEYVVNTVSYNNEHHVTGVWLYEKDYYDGNIPIYKQAKLVHLPEATFSLIKDFTQKALNAIDYHYGFSHIELFLANQKPIMIEINLRLPGIYGYLCKLEKFVYGASQAEKLIDLINSKKISRALEPEMEGKVLMINNIANNNYIVPAFTKDNFKDISEFTRLEMHQNIEAGKIINYSKNLADCLLYMMVVSKSQQKANSDTNLIYKILKTKYKLCLF